MAHEAKLAAAPRSGRGKGAAREMRRQGRIPAVIYGHHREAEALEVDGTAVSRLLSAIGRSATMVELTIEGRETFQEVLPTRQCRADRLRKVRRIQNAGLDSEVLWRDSATDAETRDHLD